MSTIFRTLLTCYCFLFILGNYFAAVPLEKLDSMAFAALGSNSAKAEQFAMQLLAQTKNNDTSLYTINAYTILGIVNKDKGYYLSALNYYLKALNAAEKKKDEARISSSMNNIGVIYQLQGNYAKAIDYFSKSLKIEEKYNNPLQKSIRYYNIGDCYKSLDSFDFALSYFNNSLLIEKKYRNKEGIIYAYLGIAEVYLLIKQKDDARRMLLRVKEQLQDNNTEENVLFHKLEGNYYFASNDFESALKELAIAEKISTSNKYPIHLQEIYRLQIEIYEAKSDWIQLSKTYKTYVALNEKLSAIDIRNKIHDLSFNNDLQKKDLEIALVQEERDFANRLKGFNVKVTWFLLFLVGSIIALVIIGVKKKSIK